jgi:hypothetical protein
MEGGVMQARTFRKIAYFDNAVRQLRRYFDYLERAGAGKKKRPTATRRARNQARG